MTKSTGHSWRWYGDLAWTWPMISRPEEYEQETETFCELIREFSRIPVRTVLDIGCGGGHNDYHVKKHFQVTGVDISADMLDIARTLNPEAEYLEGDMRTMRLSRLFDAVAIFDAINYMQTPDELRAAFQTGYEHLKPGGVLITFVEDTPDRFDQNRTDVGTTVRDGVEVTFVANYYDPDPDDTTYETTCIFLVRKDGKQDVHVDRHRCGLFPMGVWLEILEQTGFEVTERPMPHTDYTDMMRYPILVCVKPT